MLSYVGVIGCYVVLHVTRSTDSEYKLNIRNMRKKIARERK